MQAPKVTVLLPVYNGELYLRAAVKSVLEQSFRDFEFIVIDDGSTDGTPALLAEFKDPRLKVIRNTTNRRLIACLNHGVEIARGEYIARMDADDICHPERLKRQVQYLDAHRDVDVVGSDIIIFETDPRLGFRPSPPPTSHSQIRWELLRTSCLYHPTVMYRRSLFETETAYDPEYVHCEDYELWLRLSRTKRLENLPMPLLYYRRHGASITSVHTREQRVRAEKALSFEIQRRIGVVPSRVVTGLLMEPSRIAEIDDLTEFRSFFSRLLGEMLSQPGLTSQDRVYIRLSACTTIGRLIIQAAKRRRQHVLELIRMLVFDLKFDFRSILQIPVYISQIISRRSGVFERFMGLKVSLS